MTDEITIISPSLSDFLGRIGLPAPARERVIAIDRTLAKELASNDPDVDGCASLVIEATDMITDRDPLGFVWSGWGDDGVDDTDSFDFEGIDRSDRDGGRDHRRGLKRENGADEPRCPHCNRF